MKKRIFSMLLCVVMIIGLLPTTALAVGQSEFTLTVPATVSKNASAEDDYVYIKSLWHVDDAVDSVTSNSNIKDSYITLQYYGLVVSGTTLTPELNGSLNFNEVKLVGDEVRCFLLPDTLENLNAEAYVFVKIPAAITPSIMTGGLVSEIGSTRRYGLSGTFYVSDTHYNQNGASLGKLKLGQKKDGYKFSGILEWGGKEFLSRYSISSAAAQVNEADTHLPTAGNTAEIKLSATAMTDLGTDAGAFQTPATITRAEVLVNGAAAEGVSVSTEGSSVVVTLSEDVYNSIGSAASAEVQVRLFVTMPGRTDGVWTNTVTTTLAAGHNGDHGSLTVTGNWTSWDGTGDFPGGNVYLTNNVTLTEPLIISSGTVNLCLNGYSITRSENRTITVNDGATLNLCDCNGSGQDNGSVTNNADAGIRNEGTLTVYGGTVECPSYGINNTEGTVYVSGGIVQATSNSGRGIYSTGGTVTVSGGTVQATSRGYGIYSTGGTVSVSGGTVKATGSTGAYGIYSDNGMSGTVRVTVSGGTVSGTTYGIYNYGGEVTVSDGTVSGTAHGIYNSGGEVTVSDGTVSGDTGIYSDGTAIVEGGTITGTTYGIQNYGGTVSVSVDPTISGTSAGIYLAADQTITITDELTNTTPYSVYTAVTPTAGSPVAITNGTETTDYSDKFTTVNTDYKIDVVQGEGTYQVVLALKPTDFTATVNLTKDGAAWTDSGKTVALYRSDAKKYDLTGSNGVYTASNVAPGTYDVYVDGADTNVDVSNTAATADVEYFTVSYSMGDKGATGTLPESAIVLKGSTYIVSTSTPLQLDGYSQSGWNTTELFNGNRKDSLTVDGRTTLKPSWRVSLVVNKSATYNNSSVDAANGSVVYVEGASYVMTALHETFTGANYTYVWKDGNDNKITGATDASYSVQNLIAGTHQYKVTVKCEGPYGGSAEQTQKFKITINETTPITGTVVIELPTGDDTPNFGDTLTANYDGTETVSYQWYHGDTPIDGATNNTYTLTAADIDKTIKVKVTGTGNYSGTVESAATSTVTKAIPVYTAPTAITGLEYTGQPQSLVNAGTATGGTMQYNLGGQNNPTGTWSTSIPTKTDAGTYYVWYKIVGDTGYEDVAQTYVAVTIGKAPATSTPDSSSYTVNYAAETITFTNPYEVSTKNDGSGTTIASGDISGYLGQTIYIRAKGDSNHESSEWVSISIAARPAAPVGVAVTNETIAGQSNGSVTGITAEMEYKIGTGAWTPGPADLTGLAADTQITVRVKATAAAPHGEEQTYTVGEGSTLTVTFDAQNGSTVAPVTGLSYNATLSQLPETTRTGYTFGGWFTEINGGGSQLSVSTQITGNITYYAKWTEKNAVSITETAQTYTWDGNPKSFEITGTPNTGFTVQYKINGNWTTTAPSAVGTYDVKVTRVEDDTYKAYEKTITGGLVINAATPDVVPPAANTLTYNGIAQELITAGSATGGTMQYALGENENAEPTTGWNTTIPTASDAGTYYVWYKVVGDSSHNDTDPQCISVTIDKAEVEIPEIADKVFTGETLKADINETDYYSVKNDGGINVGEYDVVLTLKDSQNYKWEKGDSEPLTLKFNITAAAIEDVTHPTPGDDLFFTNEPQELITAGSSDDGTMQYALGENENDAPTTGWSTTIPTASDAGTYYVWYKVDGGDNYNDSDPVCITVTIAPGYYATVTGGSGDGWYPEGALVEIEAEDIDDYNFDKWEVVSGEIVFDDETAAETSFVMPDTDVEVKAVQHKDLTEEFITLVLIADMLEEDKPVKMPEKPDTFGEAVDTYSIYMADRGFVDVARSDWFYGDVTALANKGVVGGYPDGSFMPYGEVTWGEALKMVMKAVGYGDIAPTGDHWASGYLETALADLLISGEVELDAVVAREDVANLTAQALKLAPAGIEYPFDDYAPEAAVALYAAGIIKGSADDGQLLFRAESTITRAEMSAIVWRVYCAR